MVERLKQRTYAKVVDPKVDEVLAYHPVMTRPAWIPVKVESEPYVVGAGELIVKARTAEGRPTYPCLDALERIEGLTMASAYDEAKA